MAECSAVGPLNAQVAEQCVGQIQALLDGDQAQVKNAVRHFLKTDGSLRDSRGMDQDLHRELVLRWCERLARAHLISLKDVKESPRPLFSLMEEVGAFDGSMAIKLGVQYSLWGCSVLKLGTERHSNLIPHIEDLSLPGCFALTEVGHGSNARNIETTAEYDPATEEFIIHTPNEAATKYWIGNAALHGRMATVFAQLLLNGKNLSVHAFVVPIRNQDGSVASGVTIWDCGAKNGLAGVDNGAIAFNRVRIPRRNLLNRYADVTPDGKYQSAFANPLLGFAATVGELVAGRVAIGGCSISTAKVGLTIAIRYGFSRRQFGPPGAEEVLLMSYPSHQRRLIPLLARTYCLNAFYASVSDMYARKSAGQDLDEQEIHALAAAIKVAASVHCSRTLQTCRECCGGQGYRAKNRLGQLKADSDIFQTFEGDNTVLLQQVTKYLLAELQRQLKIGQFSGVLAFLTPQMLQSAEAAVEVDAAMGPPEAVLMSPRWQEKVFELREAVFLAKLAARLQGLSKQNLSPFDAWTAALPEVLRVAWAHIDRLTHTAAIELFLSGPVATSPVGPIVARLVALNALGRIEDDLGFFVAHGVVSSALGREVEGMVTMCSQHLSPCSPALCQAFAIPERWLPPPHLEDWK